MSTLSMSNAALALPRLLDVLSHLLTLAEANAEERGIDPQVFLDARLAPDMWPLRKQVQTVAEFTMKAPYRLVGDEPPSYDGVPANFAACHALIAQVKTDFAKIDSARLDGTEDRAFILKMGPGEMEFTGIRYLSGFLIPNLHFHLTTIYNILRHNGVPLGKRDYFGGPSA
jgi:hypothetical protein